MENNENNNANKPKGPGNKVGACWMRTSKNGVPFMTGVIDKAINPGTRIVIFQVKTKLSEKSPDYQILESEPINGKVPF